MTIEFTLSYGTAAPDARPRSRRGKGWRYALMALALVGSLAQAGGVSAEPGRPARSVLPPAPVTLPPTSGVFDYQLGGPSNRLPRQRRIDVVVRDATEKPLPRAYNICYVNGFQTQPDAAAIWRAHPELLVHTAQGALLTDPDWPDEYVLDPSTPAKREGIVRIIGPMIEGCKRAGFKAVEIDNLDTFTRFNQVSKDGALALAKRYVQIAHDAGLAIAQKNTAELAPVGKHQLGFDFAIAESCAAWGECQAYTQAYGSHVLQIEYPDSLKAAKRSFKQVCRSPHRAPLTILRDRNLVAHGQPGFIYQRCATRR